MNLLEIRKFKTSNFQKKQIRKKEIFQESNAATLLFLWLLFHSYFFSYILIHQLT